MKASWTGQNLRSAGLGCQDPKSGHQPSIGSSLRWIEGWRPKGELPSPTEFPHGPAGVPDLGHVADLSVLKLHHVHIVGAGAFAGWRHRAALAAVSAGEHSAGADVVALMVGGEGLDLVAPVGEDHEHALHPVGVLLERLHVGEWLRLGCEARAGLAVGTAHGPAFARLAGVEEGSCRLGDGPGGGGHGLTPSPSCRLWAWVRSKKVRPTGSLPQAQANSTPRTATCNQQKQPPSAPLGKFARC